MSKKSDLPAMPFYVGDWLKCPEVRALSPAARGLWIDMLCFMWESTERGYLTLNQKPIDLKTLSRMSGFAEDLLTILLQEMENFAVFSRRNDGAIFNRRMVKDQEIREIRAISGQKGGFATAKIVANQSAKKQQITENENESINTINKVYTYNEFYDKEISELNDTKPEAENYRLMIKFLFGENDLEKKFDCWLNLREQLTYTQFEKLIVKARLKKRKLKDMILSGYNNPKKYLKGNVSIYATLNSWLNR
jgi:hypothetical protein